MAIPTPLFDHSTADDDDLGTDHALAWKRLSRVLGQTVSARFASPRIFYSFPEDDDIDATLAEITAWTERAVDGTEPVVVQLGAGEYDASNFSFHGFTDVVVRGIGPATRIIATDSAQGTAPALYPDTVNFSKCQRCGIENLDIIFQDSGTNLITQGAISRAKNSAVDEGLNACWIKDVNFDVKIHANRIDAGDMVFAIKSIGKPNSYSTWTEAAFTLALINVRIVSENCGLGGIVGEIICEGCEIWFAGSTNSDTPHHIGIEWDQYMRMYWRGGRILMGYKSPNPSTDNWVVGIRSEHANSNGRIWLYDAELFSHNDGSSNNIWAVYINDPSSSGANSPWLRMTGCYCHAEDADGSLVGPSIYTDFDPSVDAPSTDNTIQCDYNVRIAGVGGSVGANNDAAIFGTDGAVHIDDHDYTLTHSVHGNYYVTPTTTDRTLTMHSEVAVNNDFHNVRNIGTANNVIIAVATGDYLDGTENGSLTIPPGGGCEIRGHTDNGTDVYFVTRGHNWSQKLESFTWSIDGTATATTYPGFFAQVGANETLSAQNVRANTASGTCDVQIDDDGVAILPAVMNVTSTASTDSTGGDVLATDSYIHLEVSNISSPVDLVVTLECLRTTVTQGS